jgi:predicted Fe-Mo cluster-binding NifX family protein
MNYKVAVPTANGILCSHFGHCEAFTIFEIKDNDIVSETTHPTPEHQPGAYPRWLVSQGVTLVLAGGMGHKAISLFQQQNIDVKTGISEKSARELVSDFIADKLETGINACDH